jgi:hypothetical protein
MKSVAFCGSTKFEKEMREFGGRLRDMGVTTFMPHLYRASGGVWENLSQFDQQSVA